MDRIASRAIALTACGLAFLAWTAAPSLGFANQDSSKLDGKSLKTLMKGMGYELKDLNVEEGKEKYETTVASGGYNIPIAAEVSPSKNYIWLTVYLLAAKDMKDLKGTSEKLLRQNHKMQPSQFYITDKDSVMLGIAIDNRGVDAAVMKRNVEKVVNDVVASANIWGEKQ